VPLTNLDHTSAEENNQQESHAVARKPRDAAAVLLVCALLTALSIPYSQTAWNSVAGFVCVSVRTVFQNASSPSFLVRLG